MMTRVVKRLIIGTPVSTEDAGHALLPKRLALPIFASDALSSEAYATQEILLVLTLGVRPSCASRPGLPGQW